MNNNFDEIFSSALAKIPEMPDCYGEVVQRIQRRKSLMRTLWAVAAILAISLTSFVYIDVVKNHSIQPAVADELQSIHSLLSGEDIHEELVTCSLVDGEMYYSIVNQDISE